MDDNNNLEDLGGQRVIRDTDGKFLHVELDSAVASARSKKRWADEDKAKTVTVDSLLREAGYDDPTQAPEHLKVLAQYAAGGRSGAVSALRDFRALTKQEITVSDAVTVEIGQRCPTCHQFNWGDWITPAIAQSLLAILPRPNITGWNRDNGR